MIRKFLSLSLIMMIAFVTACSGNNNTGSEAEPSPTNRESEDSNAEAIQKGTYKFDTPVTITTVKATDTTMKFKNGETVENNVHTQWAREQLGINIKYLWQVPGDQFATKMRLMLTSNEDLPDVLMTEDMTLLNELIQSGKYKDISEDYDKYASQTIKDIYSSHPLMWSQVTFDGKKMAFPNFAHAGNDNGVMWIRQDWLDELDMKAPATVEELEALMQAILDKKPGGSDNMIPLGVSLGAGGSNPYVFGGWLGESTWVFGPSGTVPNQWLEKDGKLVHGSTLPEMKEGLARLRAWYEKGYISKEAGLHDENKLAELIGQGRVGIVVAPYWMAGWPTPDLEKNVPGATMNPYPLPTLNGKAAARDTNFLRGGMIVKKDFKHTDALFLYLNRIFEKGKVGSEFENGWYQDYDYTIKADKTISVDENDIPGGKVGPAKYLLMEPKNPFTNLKRLAKMSRGEEPSNVEEERTKRTSSPNHLKAAEIVDNGWNDNTYIPNAFTGSPTKTMQSKNGILAKLEGETFLGIIYGKKPLNDFDNFVHEWYKIGGEQVTNEANEWFQSQ
ncbi:carbohydrate ABC transporter substrate-binding protein, CUT1 family [Paenibacillus sp. cl141a]|uniref:extracellular solute-binding protein n=1 Tax=Paenibacillus sp. cl141a TaxID=1761877 RepID=UPI0008B57778|nr:extracellular solute-binding protein [Paenibacillus sp. cl141a]SEL94629.1 carbohydrate ABC transporter substrate-binding protein, CUT1 family [Paenibacillus sp. cl141a]